MANAFSSADLTLVASDILAVCDAKDGAIDGMVLNTNACNYEDYDPPDCSAPARRPRPVSRTPRSPR